MSFEKLHIFEKKIKSETKMFVQELIASYLNRFVISHPKGGPLQQVWRKNSVGYLFVCLSVSLSVAVKV